MRPPQPQVRRGRPEPARTPPDQDPGAATGEETDDPILRETAERLQERGRLQHAMETRPTIDMALGILMAGFTCQPDDASKILVDVSQHSNVNCSRSPRPSHRALRDSRSPQNFRSTWRPP
ncbi:ANTAR domain-containing protein [Streptomyces chartreusis]|uniref:ANTAR domain-containing protein n=1 Tax=Streptomyces TaxID=1883 RepID=UPI000B835116